MTQSQPPSPALQKARELAREHDSSRYLIEGFDTASEVLRHKFTGKDAAHIAKLYNAFPSILSELEKVTKERDEAVKASLGLAKSFDEATAEIVKLRQGYTGMREALKNIADNTKIGGYSSTECGCIAFKALTSFHPLQDTI